MWRISNEVELEIFARDWDRYLSILSINTFTMRLTNPNVDFFFGKATKWKAEYEVLRLTLLDCGLTEELKWGVPCYTYQKNNVVLIHGFKAYCALLFHKGVLLSDSKGLLIQPTENVQSARQIRFTSVEEIMKLQTTLQAYIHEAIEVEKAGLKVTLKQTEAFVIVEAFEAQLTKQASLRKAFYQLTPGRQRAYLLYFAAPKTLATRTSRVAKCIPKILNGKGLND